MNNIAMETCTQKLQESSLCPGTGPTRRFHRDDQDRSIASSNEEVPVIDMQRLINSNDHQSMNLELNKLHFAAKEQGFFQHLIMKITVEKRKKERNQWWKSRLVERELINMKALIGNSLIVQIINEGYSICPILYENNLAKLGGSLPVPSVQELAKGSPEKVPPRYLRDDQQLIPMIKSDDYNIPIINMESLLLGDEFELKKLDSACREWGFFQVINHGVSDRLVEKVKRDTQDFFNLPMEEKEILKQKDGDLDGYGQAFVVSEEQKLDWADMFFLLTLPPYFRKQHIFSNLPQPFRGTVELYATEMKELALKIMDFLAKALNIDEEYIKEQFGEGMQSMRMNYYPPCPQPDKVIGLTPHSDATGLTILLQLNQMEGLQIKKDGMWIPISPLPNAFIINIGDILEIVTNGAYRSIEHRATVNSEKERLSIATFYSTKLDGQIGPAPSIISAENPAKFRSIGAADYFRGLFARKLDKKSYLDAMRIENSENPASRN